MKRVFIMMLYGFVFLLVSCSNENASLNNESQFDKGEKLMENRDDYQYIYADSFTVVTSYTQLEELNENGWEISGYDENYFIANNLLMFHFTKNSQENILGVIKTSYDVDNETLYIDIEVQSPGYFSAHDADIQQANILIDVDKTNNINEVGILVYNESLDEYHSIYYNCSMKTWEDYLEIPNS